MNPKLKQMLKAQIAELEIFVEFTQVDDTQALEAFSAILSKTLGEFDRIQLDERPKCDHCNDRMSPEDDVGNDLCIKCDKENREYEATRESSYQTYISRTV